MRENILPVMPQFVKRESEKILPDPKKFSSTLFYLRFSDGLTFGAILREGVKTKNPPAHERWRAVQSGGELGIRTPDSLRGNTRLAGEHLRPLGQLSVTAVL